MTTLSSSKHHISHEFITKITFDEVNETYVEKVAVAGDENVGFAASGSEMAFR